MVRAAVTALAGLAVTVATAAVPAVAAPQVTQGTGWAQVAAGLDNTCAIRTDGTLWCWGDNNSGDLGIGNGNIQDVPRQVTSPAVNGWTSVTAGNFHTCAIRTGGTLWCWGASNYGQLGLGNGASQDRPRQVTAPAAAGWASVTAGGFQTCATRTDTTLWCWGDNYWGELGIGHHPDQHQPAQVTTPGPHEWAGVASSGQDTCALRRTGGTLWCWGDAADGTLGIGPRPNQFRPQQVTIPT